MRGTAAELAAAIPDEGLRGEIVVLFGRPEKRETTKEDLKAALAELISTLPVKEASALVAAKFGMPRRDIYALAIEMKKEVS